VTTPAERIRLLRELRSVRRFRQDPVPQQAVEDLLEVARWTASSNNRQPWELILVRDRETLLALGSQDGSAGVRHLAGAALAVVLVPAGKLTDFDAGRWCERVMLAAAAHGLGAALAWFDTTQSPVAGAVLGVPADRSPRIAVSVGYPASDRAHLVSVERDVDDRMPLGAMPLGRKPIAEILHLDRYGRHP